MSHFVPAIQTDDLAFRKITKNGTANPPWAVALPKPPAAMWMLVALKPPAMEEGRCS